MATQLSKKPMAQDDKFGTFVARSFACLEWVGAVVPQFTAAQLSKGPMAQDDKIGAFVVILSHHQRKFYVRRGHSIREYKFVREKRRI